eukprot:Skav222779  [mRNA]  locus=scaffold600:465899:470917:+ [translate_table: standard]
MAFRKLGYKQIWSDPVPSHLATIRGEGSFRGQAIGVSVHATLPVRPSRIALSSHIDRTRLVASIVQYGSMSIQCISVYGYTTSHPEARQKTNDLIHEATRIATLVGIPSIIAGDFNHPMHQLPAITVLQSLGYKSTLQLHQTLHQQEMPMTCRNATCNDQIFVHPDLIQHCHTVQVLKQGIVSDHDPVLVDFHLPAEAPAVMHWAFPQSWAPMEPDPQRVAEHFVSDDHDAIPTFDKQLQAWSRNCERAVSAALTAQHAQDPVRFPLTQLPKSARGRCQDRKPVRIKLGKVVPQACQGQYNPPAEAVPYHMQLWIKQLRRLQSFKARLSKHHQRFESAPIPEDLLREWKAITKASGFKSFPAWCIAIPELGYYPVRCPDLSFLEDVIAHLQHHTTAKVNQHHYNNKKHQKFMQKYDEIQRGMSQTMRRLKGVTHPPVEQITIDIEVQLVLTTQDHGLVEFQVDPIHSPHFQVDQHIQYAQHDVILQFVSPTTLQGMLIDEADTLPDRSTVTISATTANPQDMASRLHGYWTQFWGHGDRTELFDPATWEQFANFLEAVPRLPTLDIQFDQLDTWKFALRKTKAKSATGYDGWYTEELKLLPDNCIATLATIVHRAMSNQQHANTLAHAITLPLGKTPDASTPDRVRPITLLPVLYRLIVKVITVQALAQWGLTIPPEIIGFLPGRSPQQHLLKQQHQLERIHNRTDTAAPHQQGCTLDLTKCFNLIPRLPAKWAMEHAGIPPMITHFWFHTLNDTLRWWKIDSQYFFGGRTDTGTPEGDGISVLACVALSRVWTEHLKAQATVPAAYADNWSWQTSDTPTNIQAIQFTVDFTSSLMLRIDWSKTWLWNSTPGNHDQWMEAIRSACPQAEQVLAVPTARELGYTVNYSKVHSRQTQQQRHDQALELIVKARKKTISLQGRARICHWAMVKALWGTESYVVGQSWLQQLRSKIARTLLIEKTNCNPFLVLLCASSHVRDPELYVILQSFRAVRAYLQFASEQDQHAFLRFVACHTGRHYDVWGPAGAFRYNLDKLGWLINAQGTLFTDAQADFHLLRTSWSDLEQALEYAWSKHVAQVHLHRSQWRNLPPIDQHATHRIMKKLEDREQTVYLQYLSGASRMGAQLKHFARDTPECPFCTAEDTLEHRLLECHIGETCRNQHDAIVSDLRDGNPTWMFLPAVFHDPFYEFCTWWHQVSPHTQPVPQVLRDITDQPNVHWAVFTDGSCDHPAEPTLRRAAFAIVVSPLSTPEEQGDQLAYYDSTKGIPSNFQTLQVGPIPGRQTVARAELLALIEFAQLRIQAVVYTDSQYVISVVQLLLNTTDIRTHANRKNYDLLLRLWPLLADRPWTIQKVAAHKLDASSQQISVEQRWFQLGNHAADTAAKAALTHLHEITPLPDAASNLKEQITRIHQMIPYLTELQQIRAKQFQHLPEDQPLGTEQRPWQTQIDDLATWRPLQSYSYSFQEQDDDVVAVFPFGSRYCTELLHWLKHVEWPPDDPAPPPDSPGVSWYELALSFQLSMQIGVVMNVGKQGLKFQRHRLAINDDRVEFGEIITQFERALTMLQATFDRQLIPTQRKNCNSIRILGGSHARAGLAARPHFPCQDQICQMLVKHFAGTKTTSNALGPPIIPVQSAWYEIPDDDRDAIDDLSWKDRIRRYQCLRKSRTEGRQRGGE